MNAKSPSPDDAAIPAYVLDAMARGDWETMAPWARLAPPATIETAAQLWVGGTRYVHILEGLLDNDRSSLGMARLWGKTGDVEALQACQSEGNLTEEMMAACAAKAVDGAQVKVLDFLVPHLSHQDGVETAKHAWGKFPEIPLMTCMALTQGIPKSNQQDMLVYGMAQVARVEGNLPLLQQMMKQASQEAHLERDEGLELVLKQSFQARDAKVMGWLVRDVGVNAGPLFEELLKGNLGFSRMMADQFASMLPPETLHALVKRDGNPSLFPKSLDTYLHVEKMMNRSSRSLDDHPPPHFRRTVRQRS